MIQAGLVAGDAGCDLIGASLGRLRHEMRIGQEGARHRHHVGTSLGQNLFAHVRCIDPVRSDDGDTHLAHQLLGDPCKGLARNAGGNGRNPRFVPADAGVDDRGAGLLDLLRQLDHLVESGPFRHEVDHRQAVDDDEIGAHSFSHPAHDLDGQTNAVFVRAAPTVCALVGVLHDELVEEIAFRAHHLDAVIARLARTYGGGDDICDLLFDPLLVQLLRCEGGNRRLDGRG